MTIKKVLGWVSIAALATTSLGCTVEEQGDDEDAPEFVDGSGQARWSGEEATYPEASYGVRVGEIAYPFEFYGFYDYMNMGAQIAPIGLADFYNPTGTGVYPEGHPFAGRPLPKVVVLIVSASWCGPCQQEAATLIPEERAKYGDQVIFLSTLLQGPSGDPATFADLENWTGSFPVDYPMAVDPADQIFTLYPRAAFPANLMIRTDTMQIVEAVNAAPPASFWNTVDGIIAGTL